MPGSTQPNGNAAPRLLDVLRDRLRLKHYSLRTEQQYVNWVRRFLRFHHLRHPREMGALAWRPLKIQPLCRMSRNSLINDSFVYIFTGIAFKKVLVYAENHPCASLRGQYILGIFQFRQMIDPIFWRLLQSFHFP